VDQAVAVGPKVWPGLANSGVFALMVFAAMAAALLAVGRKRLE